MTLWTSSSGGPPSPSAYRPTRPAPPGERAPRRAGQGGRQAGPRAGPTVADVWPAASRSVTLVPPSWSPRRRRGSTPEAAVRFPAARPAQRLSIQVDWSRASSSLGSASCGTFGSLPRERRRRPGPDGGPGAAEADHLVPADVGVRLRRGLVRRAAGRGAGRCVVVGVLLAGPLVCATSQAVNDWFDRHVDAINEPQRPIPSGRMPGRWGLCIAIGWTALSLLVATVLGPGASRPRWSAWRSPGPTARRRCA